MTGWRVAYFVLLLLFVALPLAAPFREIADRATWVWTDDDVARLSHLGRNTLVLTASTAVVAVPIGTLLAVLLFRTSFVGRELLRIVLAISLFIPLPIVVSSWQSSLGSGGWLPMDFWRSTQDRPWATGMGPAIWIHVLAAVPWVTFIIGIGLTWVEPELEDEAAQSSGPWGVLALVTLPRVRASILAGTLFVILQASNEISVAEIMQVNTLAEEAFTQFVLGRSGLGRTLALSLPALILVWSVVLWFVWRLERSLPPLAPPAREHRPLALGWSPLRLIGTGVLLSALVAPIGSIVWKLGLVGHPGHWDETSAWQFLQNEAHLLGKDLVATLATSLATGLLVAFLALTACWLARDCVWFRWSLFVIVTGAWVIPGPVVGIGLHEILMALPDGPWKEALYYGPSPLPLMWVQAIRDLPIAVVFLWPVVRLLPRELLDEASLAGAGAVRQWFGVVVPMTWRAVVIAGLAGSALCLGEVAASTRVATPGWDSFTKMLFDRMHFGVDNNVSALCVLMLASVVILTIAGFAIASVMRVFRRENQS
jgi:iron(III) transport system permease protein